MSFSVRTLLHEIREVNKPKNFQKYHLLSTRMKTSKAVYTMSVFNGNVSYWPGMRPPTSFHVLSDNVACNLYL